MDKKRVIIVNKLVTTYLLNVMKCIDHEGVAFYVKECAECSGVDWRGLATLRSKTS